MEFRHGIKRPCFWYKIFLEALFQKYVFNIHLLRIFIQYFTVVQWDIIVKFVKRNWQFINAKKYCFCDNVYKANGYLQLFHRNNAKTVFLQKCKPTLILQLFSTPFPTKKIIDRLRDIHTKNILKNWEDLTF